MADIYESDKLLAEYLLFHFGSEQEVLPEETVWPAGMREALGFPVRTTLHFGGGKVARGLDLGCAVGRSTFEMAKWCDHVTGIDFSHSFIAAARKLAAGESIGYARREEGLQETPLTARVSAGDFSQVEFLQGDAMALPPELAGFDWVHAANLLCRLPEPDRLLRRLPELVAAGGTLVLATPCTWLEEFTPRANWPATTTRDWLLEKLGANFALIGETEEPFLIRETARKFQWSRSLVTVWRRIDSRA